MNRAVFKRLKAQGANLPTVNYPLNPLGYQMNSCGCGCGGAGNCGSKYSPGIYTDNIGAWNTANQARRKTHFINQNGDTTGSIIEQILGVQKGEPIGRLDIGLENQTILKLSGGVFGAVVLGNVVNNLMK